MPIFEVILSKPVLVGLHLGFAILGIDFFLWLAGEIIANPIKRTRMRFASIAGTLSFVLGWIIGGYYYVVYYGSLVKPIIKEGAAPWAHLVIMETKEHLFLFVVPMAITALFLSFLKKEHLEAYGLKRVFLTLSLAVAFTALAIGLMGYIISAAARWG